MGRIKEIIRQILLFLHLDLTSNLRYDRLTRQIIRKVLKPDSNCIDIGAHAGEVLREVLRFAPKGQHYAFEPLPSYYHKLNQKYGNRVKVFQIALSNQSGSTTFHHILEAPAYSGIRRRDYDGKTPTIEEIKVPMQPLDSILPENQKIDLIKIDVEGAEGLVLDGAKKTIERCKPIILFEFGKGASEYYEIGPTDIWNLFSALEMNIFTLDGWLDRSAPMNFEVFDHAYQSGSDYYFLAQSKTGHHDI